MSGASVDSGAIPGTGVVISDPEGAPDHGPYWLAYCGMPDWWGDPRGES